jgi:adenosine deaminase
MSSPTLPKENGEKRASAFRLVRYLSDNSDNPDWKGYDDDQELFVQQLPKVELHVHLDGSFDPDFLWEYMKEHPESVYCLPVQTNLPWDPSRKLRVRELVQNCELPKDYHKLCTCRGYRSLKEMLTCFEIFLPLIRGNLDLIEQLAYDFCQRQWEQNIVYTEVRYSPHLLAEGYEQEDVAAEKVDAEAVFSAVTAGLRKGSHKFGITVNQIFSAITWRPDWALSMVELADKYRNDYPCAVVGVDIAAGEEHFDREQHPDLYQSHYDMIQRAKDLGLSITLHAGEATTGNALGNVRRAINEYGATRIGHGYRLMDSVELMQEVKDKGVHIEVCPTSSVETGGWVYENKNWKEHPACSFLKHGLSFSFSSDDPAVFHTSLSWQYRIGLAKMDFTREELLQTNLNAIGGAFCSDEEKKRLSLMVQSYGASKGLELPEFLDAEDTRRSWGRAESDGYFTDRVYLSSRKL